MSVFLKKEKEKKEKKTVNTLKQYAHLLLSSAFKTIIKIDYFWWAWSEHTFNWEVETGSWSTKKAPESQNSIEALSQKPKQTFYLEVNR